MKYTGKDKIMWERLSNIEPLTIAGVIGALLSLVYVKPLGILKTVLSTLGGIGAAYFIAPAIAHYFSFEYVTAIGFVVGLFFVTIMGIVFQILDKIREDPVNNIKCLLSVIIDVLSAAKGVTTKK